MGREFQPTLPHGERPNGLGHRMRFPDFNPRSRTGSDHYHCQVALSQYHFNPRSRTGSDSALTIVQYPACYFNPRSRTGSDQKSV